MRLRGRGTKRLALGALCLAVLCLAVAAALYVLDKAFPPPIDRPAILSAEVVDRDGTLLRPFATPEGYWRFRTELDGIDPQFLEMLIAYEDKRFWSHHGVDVPALFRAAFQWIINGHIVSGGSTITMQLARLIEPREERSIPAKLFQIVRALQIERRLSKHEILTRYLTFAPYGGNIEGVRAASLAWFGKEPRRLSPAEAALLIALPQSPEARRPDRHHDEALAARNRVLQRMAAAGVLDPAEAERLGRRPVAAVRRAMPQFAAHAAGAAMRAAPAKRRVELTIDRSVQEGLERAARDAAQRLGPKVSIAMVMADARNGEILGSVGSPDILDSARRGWIDMTGIVRSPGSALKPFIYGLAFEQGIAAPETMIEDRPADFGGYRPRNFDMGYQGDVSVRQALQMSLNIPAIRLLDAVGPARLLARFHRAGVRPQLPPGERPGLAIGLGGVGITLTDLVQLYTGLANRGLVEKLHLRSEDAVASPGAILDPTATWQVADILSGVAPPQAALNPGIAYKTGTSYGYRDAWSVGFDGRHVLGVWVGRADGSSVPGISGYTTAAPILFDAFRKSRLGIVPLPRPPAGALHLTREQLPVTLQRFVPPGELPATAGRVSEAAPRIVFPPDGAHVELAASGGDVAPLVVKLQGGRAPFRWLADGRPIAGLSRTRISRWQPPGIGYSRLTVVDAIGRAASVGIFVE